MTPETLTLTLAQINPTVGDIAGNCRAIIAAAERAQLEHGADIVVFPELVLCGYPPEDLLLRPDFYAEIQAALAQIRQACADVHVILGHPEQLGKDYYNKASVFHQGNLQTSYYKQVLPNYGVFDERRYFTPGSTPTVFSVKGVRFGLLICEDLWADTPCAQTKAAGAELIISINASPFDCQKRQARTQLLKQRAREQQIPIAYVNLVGGQDELVFDGQTTAVDADGIRLFELPPFVEGLATLTLTHAPKLKLQATPNLEQTAATSSCEALIYQALVTGVRDYAQKNGFTEVMLGLSGGIDSALTLAIAVDALGPAAVTAVMMPSQHTHAHSSQDAQQQAHTLGCQYKEVPISDLVGCYIDALAPVVNPDDPQAAQQITNENLQARCRGTLLMALANRRGALVLNTGNKSEMAVGYTTLYGDMVGGFCVLKDIAKTLVYRLADHRNRISPIIPERVIDRPPSAELAPNQTDEDSLPAYPLLDDILARYIEQDMSIAAIVDAGFDPALVRDLVRRIHRNEYKRRQAAPGVKISTRAFGRERRYPITSRFDLPPA